MWRLRASTPAFGRQTTVTDDRRYFNSADVPRGGNRCFNGVGKANLTTRTKSTVECVGQDDA